MLAIWDHPRACGAHFFAAHVTVKSTGSSPRMRGSPYSCGHEGTVEGIIPAHAGLTTPCLLVNAYGWDHPRACGAHYLMNDEIYPEWGSSPRMRGSRKSRNLTRASTGIIPAHAGLTSAPAAAAFWIRDHPRACGAHQRFWQVICNAVGSSPRMRGSQSNRRHVWHRAGIIPAHAGLTRAEISVSS